jgi:hypothetical protein
VKIIYFIANNNLFFYTKIKKYKTEPNMFKKNLILTLIMSIMYVHSMFIGKYGTPYNVLNPVFTREYATRWPIVSNFLNPETASQLSRVLGIDRINLTLNVGIYGQPLMAKVPDKTFNVACHNLVRDWLITTRGFNPLEFSVKAQIGIFEPNGITSAVSNGAAFGALRPEAVIIHGDGKPKVEGQTPKAEGQLYSPNNVRFKIDDDRQVASFWSIAVSPNNQNAALNFNLIILDEVLSARVAEVILTNNDDLGSEEFLTKISMLHHYLGQLSQPDQDCLQNSLDLIAQLDKSIFSLSILHSYVQNHKAHTRSETAAVAGGGAAMANDKTGEIIGGAAAKVKHNKMDHNLKAQIDGEIKARGNVNFAPNNGRSLLMKYSEGSNANLDAVQYLVKLGADINLEDTSTGEKGRTALAYAAYWGNQPIVEFLTSLDPRMDKSTALKYAQTSKTKKEGNHHSLAHSGTVENYNQIIQLLQS